MEADLAFAGFDYRDRFLPHGGPSRMTTRRLCLLVWALDRYESRFWAAVGDFAPTSRLEIIMADTYHAVSGQAHVLRDEKTAMEAAREREKRKQMIKANAAARRRRRRRKLNKSSM
ncbi:hypothetical protein WG936_08215 [Corynebacterium sp. H127]|uniref:hypothetical protein n=1 Tax=Corynebacterium sp. H127 TaxID=3133418 RepID=UPI0030AF479C